MSHNSNGSLNAKPSANNTVSSFSSPIYRGPLNHGASAELVEGFRILTSGRKATVVSSKELYNCAQAAGVQCTEEEIVDMLKVVHQSSNAGDQDNFEFGDFLHLMTQQVSDEMVQELKSAFLSYDKNKTGFVTKKQFTEIFISMGEKSSAEELEELQTLAEVAGACEGDGERIEYNKFIHELALNLNNM